MTNPIVDEPDDRKRAAALAEFMETSAWWEAFFPDSDRTKGMRALFIRALRVYAAPAVFADLREVVTQAFRVRGCCAVHRGCENEAEADGCTCRSDADSALSAITAAGYVIVPRDDVNSGLTAAAADVLAERRRQVEVEGWTAKHDAKHGSGDLAAAGGCYALGAAFLLTPGLRYREYVPASVPRLWPWDARWWKLDGRDPRRALVKAGALVLAEIERFDRTSTAHEEKSP